MLSILCDGLSVSDLFQGHQMQFTFELVTVPNCCNLCILNDMQAQLQTNYMPGNKYSFNSSTPRTRIERLLRERELRKNNQSFLLANEARDGNREVDAFGNDSPNEGDNRGVSSEEEFLEGSPAGRTVGSASERQDVRPPKQRLLVVANRLPVSAVRKGEDSWQLEISVGGLVSALLGKLYLKPCFG